MLFLNPWLLLGITAIAIPIIIHLLNRISAKNIKWGAMQFLVDSLFKRKRRILLEEVLLLTSRCLLLALVATALARPFVPAGSHVPWLVVLPAGLLAVVLFGVSVALWQYRKWRLWLAGIGAGIIVLAATAISLEHWLNLKRFTRSSARDVVIVLDASLSMELTVDGKPNIERAADEARKIIENADRGTAFALLAGRSFADPLVPAPINDRKEILRALDRLGRPDGVMRILDVLPAAALALGQGYNPLKQIVILTDGQSFGWETDNPAHWAGLARVFGNLPSKPQIVVRKLSIPEHIRNLSVSSISLSRKVVGTDKEVSITVKIANTGNEAVTPGAVTLKTGDAEYSDNSLGQILPGETETAVFRHHFKVKGGQLLTACLAVTDDLPGDNADSFAFNVVDNLKVLVVDNGYGDRFMDRSGAYSVMALAPGASSTGNTDAGVKDKASFVDPALVDSASLVGLRDLDKYCAMILSDVTNLSADSAMRIVKFVENGGGLLVVPGDHTGAEFMNAWRTTNGIPVLPAPLDERVVIRTDREGAKPAITTFDHPALTLVSGASKSDIGSVESRSYWRISDPVMDEHVRVCARFNNGDPFILERKIGLGTVILMSSSFDTRGGNLPTRHVFVPLLHELVYYLSAQASVRLNMEPARNLSIPLPVEGEMKVRGNAGMIGLTGEYFTDKELKKRIATRVDAQVNFDWGDGAVPIKRVPANNFSVRWTGSIRAPSSGTYNFHVEVDDGARLWVGGKQLINQWQDEPPTWYSAPFNMDGGKTYDIKMEYFQGTGSATARLFWDGPGIGKQAIPSEFLFPGKQGSRVQPQESADEYPVIVDGPPGSEVDGTLSIANGMASLKVDGRILSGEYNAKLTADLKKMLSEVVSASGNIPFSIIRCPDESRVTGMVPDDMEFVRKYGDFIEAQNYEDIKRVIEGYMIGEELWRYLALGALLILLVETLLARWISGGRKIGRERSVEFDATIRPSDSFQGKLDKLKRGSANG